MFKETICFFKYDYINVPLNKIQKCTVFVIRNGFY